MPNITLSLPKDIYKIVKEHKEIRWSEIARQSIAEYAKKLAFLDKLTKESKLTEKDIDKIDEDIKAAILNVIWRKMYEACDRFQSSDCRPS